MKAIFKWQSCKSSDVDNVTAEIFSLQVLQSENGAKIIVRTVISRINKMKFFATLKVVTRQ
jgi:hypothetical protein